ncbi:MAG: hypothetical protein U0893_18050 [Chloroflexota bacterium]
MSDSYSVSPLAYPLRDGYVVNWLVAGPEVSPESLGWDDGPGIEGRPAERGPLGTGSYRVGGPTGTWAYHACPDDGFVDRSGSHPPGRHLRSWAYAELVADTARTAAVELTATGPAGLWLDGVLALRLEGGSARAQIALKQGTNPVLIRFADVSTGETPHAAALRVESIGLHVQIPTCIDDVGRRTAFERLTAGTFLERDIYEGGTPIVLRWPEGERGFCPAHVRLHGPDDAIYALADTAGEPGTASELGYALSLPSGPLRVTLMPSPDEVYLHDTRVTHELPFWSMGRQRYVSVPTDSDLATRRGEALLAVAEHADSVYGQIARMALGVWSDVEAGVLMRACERLDAAMLVALVGMLHRFGERAEPGEEVLRVAEGAVFGYDAWSAPGSEATRILRHAAETLAGQRYPDRAFADGQPGSWHRARGEQLALDWMRDFATHGSAQPSAPYAIEAVAVALSHLADLAESPAAYEMAAVCLDKLLFMLALHSRQGVLGAASRSVPASIVKSGLLQPTSPLSRLLWGAGIYNHHLAGALSLALASEYEPPPILEAIARDAPDELWSVERHAPPGAEPAHLVTFKTPEYVLSSLADVRPGGMGHSELIWRATMSPQAMVFVNQPGSSSESDARLPGYWAGNARLPRVAQWRETLIAMHRVAEHDLLPWTHAHFPCATFDEYALRDGWAFAQVGDGYLAITCSTGMALTREGRYALRELRAPGPVSTWLVQMGRAALDGDFLAFQTKVLAAPYTCGRETVHWSTIRGDELQLDWDGLLRVNGAPLATDEGRHVENAYTTAELPCVSMDIRLGDDVLRLDFTTS